MWYVVQTQTGGEQELLDLIRQIVSKDYYEDCFYIRRESYKKKNGKCETDLCPLFPSYVFVDTDVPEQLFFELKKVPRLTKLLSQCRDSFSHVSEEEKRFLESIQDERHVVRRSLVEVDEEGQILWAGGAVGLYQDRIVRQRLRKRYVWIEQEFLGKRRKIYLGIKLKEDEKE